MRLWMKPELRSRTPASAFQRTTGKTDVRIPLELGSPEQISSVTVIAPRIVSMETSSLALLQSVPTVLDVSLALMIETHL